MCPFCHGACDPEYGQCYQCLTAERSVGAVDILPISMSLDGGLLHAHLRGYKDNRSAAVRARMSRRLAALLAVFVEHHRMCIGSFDSVVGVPSATRSAVASIVAQATSVRDVYRPALSAVPGAGKDELRAGRFEVTRSVADERLLVLDDTFTSGATLFSGVAALREAGAVVVGPVVLGRHVQPGWPPSRRLLSWLGNRPWDERRCCRCGGELENPGRLL